MELTIETYILINFILVLSSILQMATGVTVGIIIVPFLAMISYTLIPVPIAFASLALTVMMAYKGREHIDTKNIFQISLGMIAGILLSIFILKNIKFEYLGLVFGVFILISIFISIRIKTFTLNKGINYSGGFIAGVMGSMAAVGGQILALLFQNHSLESLKSTLAFLYTLFSTLMLIMFYVFGEFSYTQFISGIYMMPGFIIGFFIAPIFSKYFNPKYSKTVILFMATLGSLVLILKSLM
ncbi:TSUP family transporter [Arcobacter sp. LA11]|uniref:TSUP family transporter n=1 Tax=Arcobacter sp. LA11 TaxID=1898176 RepID=UPI000933AA89|nr:TSUP family transporter [Arcobacter sp. LA11]